MSLGRGVRGEDNSLKNKEPTVLNLGAACSVSLAPRIALHWEEPIFLCVK